MTTATHQEHTDHTHVHGEHVAVPHGDHVHDSCLHAAHDSHYDEH